MDASRTRAVSVHFAATPHVTTAHGVLPCAGCSTELFVLPRIYGDLRRAPLLKSGGISDGFPNDE